MGTPALPKPPKPPPPEDLAKAQINALAYAEIQRRIRSSSGRAGQFATSPAWPTRRTGWNTALGM